MVTAYHFCPVRHAVLERSRNSYQFLVPFLVKILKHISSVCCTDTAVVHYIDKLEALGQCIPPPRHVLPLSRYGSGSGSVSVIRIATKILSLVHWPTVPTFPENFTQIRPFGSFCSKLLTDRQTDRQTVKQKRRKHNVLGGGISSVSSGYRRQNRVSSIFLLK